VVSQELTLLTRTRRRTPGCDRSTSTSIVSTARVVPTLSAPGRVGCRRTGRLNGSHRATKVMAPGMCVRRNVSKVPPENQSALFRD
jgi:hypothetical protein